jgi:hypothetical protein
MSFREAATQQFPELGNHGIEVIEAGLVDVSKLDCAVLLLHSSWSEPSTISCRSLFEELKAVPNSPLKVFILNVDAINPDELEKAYGEISQGWGEAFWIKDGQIAHRDHGYSRRGADRLIKQRIKVFCLGETYISQADSDGDSDAEAKPKRKTATKKKKDAEPAADGD